MHTFAIVALLAFQAPLEVKDLSWLAGRWTGSMGRASIEENWSDASGGAMLAVSRTIVGERLVAFEFLRIVKKADGVYYVAQPGGRPPVEFKLTKTEKVSAVFENPQHDHPKIITYKLEGEDGLVATIEGDEKGQHKKQEFRFRRQAH